MAGEVSADVGGQTFDYGGVGFGYDTSGDIAWGVGKPSTSVVYGPSPAAEKFALLRAQEEAGDLPTMVPGADVPVDGLGIESTGLEAAGSSIGTDIAADGALDLAAVSFAPETLGLSLVLTAAGGVTAHYVLHYLSGTFHDDSVAADMAEPGDGQNAGLQPTWVHVTSGICNSDIPGWETPDSGDGGFYYLSWGGNDQDWSGTFSTNGNPQGSCGIPNYAQSSYDTQVQADLQAYWDAANADAGASNCPGDEPSWIKTRTNVAGVDWYVLAMTGAQYAAELSCSIYEEEPGTVGSPTHGATITAPIPSETNVDTGTGALVGAHAGISTAVTQDFQQAGATVSPGIWEYDGAQTVTYGPLTVPSGDDEARIYCTDDNSASDWSSVAPGATVTLTRTGVGFNSGDGPDFQCYVDTAPDTTGTPSGTADPEVAPNPEDFTYGDPTDTAGAPGGGGNCNCSFDFGPITGLAFGSVFPFGVVGYLGNILGQMQTTGQAPSFDITAGHTWHIDLASASWENTVKPIAFPVLEFLIAVGAIVFVALRHFRRGTADA
jgi:hypothetical protein